MTGAPAEPDAEPDAESDIGTAGASHPEAPASSKDATASAAVAMLLHAIALILAAVVIFAAGRFASNVGTGLDLTDEAFYLLDARHPEDQFAAPRLHWVLTAPLHRLVDGNLALHRLAGFTMLAAVGAALALVLARLFAPSERGSGLTSRAIATATIGASTSLVFYGFAVRTPGYNWATLLLATATLAAIAWSASPRRRSISALSPGALSGLALLPKLSTGLFLVTAAVAGCASIGMARGGPRAAATRAVLSVVGSLAGVAGGLAVLAIWGDPIATFGAGAEMLAPTALYGDLADRLREETGELLELWWADARVAVASAAGLAVATGLCSVLRRETLAAVFTGLALPAVVLVFGILGQGWEEVPSRPRMVLVSATIVVVAWIPVLGLRTAWRAAGRADGLVASGVLLLLVSMPLMTAAGTGNADYWRFATFGFWLLAATLPALRGLTGSISSVVLSGFGLIAIAALAGIVLVRAPLEAAYRPPADSTGFLESIEIHPGSGRISIDRGLAASIRELREIADAAAMPAGQDILACFDMPGLVLALDGRAPGTSWLFSGYLRSDLAAERALASIPPARRRRAWVLVRTPQRAESRRLEGANPDLADLFASIGRRFPEDYTLAGGVDVPFYDRTAHVELWRPRDEVSGDSDAAPVSSLADPAATEIERQSGPGDD